MSKGESGLRKGDPGHDERLGHQRPCAKCGKKFFVTLARRMLCRKCFEVAGRQRPGLPTSRLPSSSSKGLPPA